MVARFHLWWQKIKQHRVTILVVAIILVVANVLITVGYRFDWTGFNGNNKSGKTLWDWFNLLGVLAIPVVVGFGAVWFTTRQGKVADAENKDNQRETALQVYVDKMSELLLEKNLRESAEGDEVRTIARVRTLTILPRLDAKRKYHVLQFLHESGLIDRDKPIVNLSGADLREANLSGAKLNKADLSNTNLSDADLFQANLSNTYLFHADLLRADLFQANLSNADLRSAFLVRANLFQATLRGAKLSDAQLLNAPFVK